MRPRFDEYVTARSAVLLRFAYVLCGDRHLAEDLVQEVLVNTHRRWQAIEAENPDAYVKRAMVRALVSWRRRRASSEIVTAALPDRAERGFDDAHASRDEVWTMLATLPGAQRAVLVLRYFEDLDDQRIAELVGVSASTVRTHAQRGLTALRETLAQRADDAPAGTELLANVRAGVARADARRRAVAAGGIAALVAALLVAVAMLLPWRNDPPVEPTPTPTSGLELVPTALTAPEFPYAFGFLPPGAGPAYVTKDQAPHMDPRVPDDSVPETWVGFGDTLSVGMSADPTVANGAEVTASSPTTVNGQPATLVTYHVGQFGITWQQDGLWFVANAEDPISVDDLLRFVNSMVSGRTAAERDGAIDAIASVAFPAGYVVYVSDAEVVCAQPQVNERGSICIALLLMGAPQTPHLQDLTIDGDPAYTGDDGTRLIVERSDGHIVMVEFRGVPVTSSGDLVAIYRGVTFQQ